MATAGTSDRPGGARWDLDGEPPLAFRLRTALRKSAPARWWYRGRWRRRADVVVVSFPKAGRTWLRLLLAQALARHFGVTTSGALDLRTLAARDARIPRFRIKHDDDPQLKTPEELVPLKGEYRDTRVVFLARDPRDLVVSSYFQMTRREGRYHRDLSSFLQCSRGSVATIIEFFNIWAREAAVPREFLLLRYEDLHEDPVAALARLLAFAGVDDVAPTVLEHAVDFGRFENMRRLEERDALGSGRLRPGDPADPESFKTRRGVVGGYRTYLSESQITWLDRRIADELDPVYRYA